MPELPEPLERGRFVFEEFLGGGGFGEVWRARDGTMRRSVAIKLLKPELVRHPDWRARRTDTIAARLRSRHIVQVHDLIEEEGRCAVVMELLPGPSVAARLRQCRRLGTEEAIRVARGVVDALDAAHRHGVVHRDIKPGNVLYEEGTAGDVKVVDWGLALGVPSWRRESREERQGAATATWDDADGGPFRFAGTPEYMAPEQLHGHVDRSADIWAFGCLLFECLAGRRAFTQRGPQLLEAITSAAIDWAALPETVPETLRRLTAACLEVEPRRRLRNIADAYPFVSTAAATGVTPSQRPPLNLLPPPPPAEVPRPGLVERVEGLLRRSPLVALCGPAGCGKSWAALATARRQLEGVSGEKRFLAGAVAIDLREVATAEEFVGRLAKVCEQPAGADLEAIRAALGQRAANGLLLILDNADRLMATLPEMASRLRGVGVHVLVTARRAPSHGAWSVLAVDPLACPPEATLANERDLVRYEAVELFVALAAAAWRGFRLDASNAGAVAAICRRLGGLPRAIELVASRVRLASPQDLLPRLDQIVRPFVQGDAASTLAGTVEWSVLSASPAERLLLERLSIFEGSWTLASVEAVCCDDRLPPEAVHEALNGLIDQALVQPDVASTRPRYHLLGVVRDLCRRRMESAERREEDESLRRRHLQRFAALVGSGDGAGSEQVAFGFERADCCAAIRYALDHAELLDRAADLAIELQDHWYDLGRYREGIELLDPVLAAWGDRGGVRQVRLLAARAKLKWLGDPRAAHEGYRQALALQRTIAAAASGADRRPEHLRLAAVLHNCGLTAQQSFDFANSRLALDESVELYRANDGGEVGAAIVLLSLAILDLYEGNLDRSEAALVRCVGEFHRHGDAVRLSTALQYRGRIALERGDHAAAAQFTREAFALRRAGEHVEGVADSLRIAGELAVAIGDARRGTALFAAAERRRRGLGLGVPATDAPAYERRLQAARDAQTFGEFDAAWSHGHACSDEEASLLVAGLIVHPLEGPDPSPRAEAR